MNFFHILLTAWVGLFTLVATIVVATGTIIMSYLPVRERVIDAWVRGWGAAICVVSGVRVKVKGMGNIDPDGTYVFLANHQSMYDIFTILGFFPPVIKWFAKKQLFDIPLLGRAMKRAGYLSVDRSNGREAMRALKEAATTIRRGSSVVIFPEGARTIDGHLQEFKKGGFVLAIESGVPIVPVVIRNSWDILPRRSLIVRPQKVVLEVLPPIETATYSRKQAEELLNRVYDIFYKQLEV